MNATPLPPLPSAPPPERLHRAFLWLIGLAVAAGMFMLLLFLLVWLQLIRPFNVPTGAMEPAIVRGDHLLMEGISSRARHPRRGDVIVFKTDGIGHPVPPGQYYVKRVVGEPGDELRILGDRLFVNGQPAALSNAVGEIHYVSHPQAAYLISSNEVVTVPPGRYFVCGDNTRNSLDSRYWGTLPAPNIQGRIVYRYWPPARLGTVN